MLDSFIFSLSVTLPVFLVMLLGMVLRRAGLFTEAWATVTDRYVFRVALPVLLFRDIAQMDIKGEFNGGFVAFSGVSSLLMFLLALCISLLVVKNRRSVGAFAQGAARGSAAVLGVALAENIYGSSGLVPMMIFVAVPVFNVMSVILLSSADGRGGGFVRILRGVVTNPIIWGVVIGLPFSLFKVTLPAVVTRTVDTVSATATPLALLAVGAAFRIGGVGGRLRLAGIASAVKLILLPGIFLTAAALFGFRDSALVAILVMSGAPTTVTSYIMTKNMHGDHVLASDIVMLSTAASVVTVPFWVFLLRYLSLI